MTTGNFRSLGAAVLLVAASLAAIPARAQSLADPVVGVANPDALFHSKDRKLDRNMQASWHIMKELLECNQWQDAGQWLTDKYIQHNPMARSGLQGVIDFFTKTLKRPVTTPCPAKLQKTKVVAVLATGDYVTVVQPREYPVPGGKPGETYTSTWFDMWRFVDGKADEHWDPATLPAKAPGN
ncbi:MAG TPA: nuclear transport factor 2 family protein [Steroidobacteraceae bacterium]|nr:nuclear transport factor 2 family protein [Steroidobacteraceae bacterium]